MDTFTKILVNNTKEVILAEQVRIGDTIIIPDEGTFTLKEGKSVCMQNLQIGMRYKNKGKWWMLGLWGNCAVGIPVEGIVGKILKGKCDIPHPDHDYTYLHFEPVSKKNSEAAP